MHLLERQRIVRLDGGMTGSGRGDLFQRVFDPQAAIQSFQILGKSPESRVAFVRIAAMPASR